MKREFFNKAFLSAKKQSRMALFHEMCKDAQNKPNIVIVCRTEEQAAELREKYPGLKTLVPSSEPPMSVEEYRARHLIEYDEMVPWPPEKKV